VTASSTSPITGVTVIAAQILTPHEKGRSGVVFEGIDAAETSHVTSLRVSRQASGLLVKSCGNRRSGRLQGLGKHLPIGCQPCNTGAKCLGRRCRGWHRLGRAARRAIELYVAPAEAGRPVD
jgi:hypothetical protein